LRSRHSDAIWKEKRGEGRTPAFFEYLVGEEGRKEKKDPVSICLDSRKKKKGGEEKKTTPVSSFFAAHPLKKKRRKGRGEEG